MSTPGPSHLILGWQVNSIREPQYWTDPKAKAGSPKQKPYLAQIPSKTIAAHTAIIAQSGSGKSFFLGRLIEEIVLRTKSRCIIFDPNADFKRIYETESAELWTKAKYDITKRRGKLPHEGSREEFEKVWSKVPIRVRGRDAQAGKYESLKLWWPSLSVDFLGEDLDPMLRGDLYHSHGVVQALETLWRSSAIDEAARKNRDLFAEAQNVFMLARKSEGELRSKLEQFAPASLKANVVDRAKGLVLTNTIRGWLRNIEIRRIRNAIERIVALPQYVSLEVERFYFGKIREYMAAGILATVMQPRTATEAVVNRIEVIDLPSLPDKRTKLMAINALLTAEWDEARKKWDSALKQPADKDERVPTFIVVDEAHNLIPLDPISKAETALREQFRTIIAEGRKYGLFLVVVTQRPDKVDPLILSECENRGIMKLGSASVVAITRTMLGLEDLAPKALEKALEFETGRILLVGKWSPQGPQTIYGAARRTVEGGRNLRDEYWSVPS
jgi:Helicase HerA, central domain